MQSRRVRLTLPRIAEFTCPADKSQAFLWDATEKRLAVRCTPATARKTFIFESRIKGRTIRVTIGLISVWTIDDAREEARRLQRLIDQGKDPRIEKALLQQEQQDQRQIQKAKPVITADAWREFVKAKAGKWGNHRQLLAERTVQDVPGLIQGTLAPLMAIPMQDITDEALLRIIEANNPHRPIVMNNDLSLWLSFCRWCETRPDYRGMIQPAAYDSALKQHLTKPSAKKDCLQREQLRAFFAALDYEPEIIAAALAGLLLTGARKNELLNLKWADADFRWMTLDIADKVNGRRTIPLTPYVAHLLAELPQRGDYVFSGSSGAGRLHDSTLNQALSRVTARAGIPPLTVHGLRRSFGTLAEWVEAPAGVAAQIMGHAPSAIAEKHYRVRPIDLLRQWHCRIEGWILDQAGIEFAPADDSEKNPHIHQTGTDKTDETHKTVDFSHHTPRTRTDKTDTTQMRPARKSPRIRKAQIDKTDET